MLSHPTTPPIAIIGAGPSGLILARLLELAQVPYTVFERDASPTPQPHHQGGSLDIHAGTGQAALEAAGLSAQFEALARYEASVFTCLDSSGGNYFRHSDDDAAGGAGVAGGGGVTDRPEIDRRQLRGILLDSVSADRVRWGKALRAVERAEGAGDGDGDAAGPASWVLRFADGSSETGFRMIVGADGAWSKVRPLLTSAKPHYSGKTYIEGRLTPANPQYAAAQELAGAGLFTAMGAGRVLVVQQMGDRTYRMYAGLEEPEALVRALGFSSSSSSSSLDNSNDENTEASSKAALLDLFTGWAPRLRAFIQAAEGPWRVWPLYTFSPEVFTPESEEEEEKKTWTRAPGVVLLGDAAHVALPNGEGVNIAMVDALRLFERLSAELGFGSDPNTNTNTNTNAASDDEKKNFDARADAAAVERAIVSFESAMRERAREHVAEGIMMNDTMYKADGAERMIAMFKQWAEMAAPSQS